jgi:hypothetical protein
MTEGIASDIVNLLDVLEGELPRRHEDEVLDGIEGRIGDVDEWHGAGRRFARACFSETREVSPFQDRRDRLLLDGCHVDVAHLVEGFLYFWFEIELCKLHGRYRDPSIGGMYRTETSGELLVKMLSVTGNDCDRHPEGYSNVWTAAKYATVVGHRRCRFLVSPYLK